MQWAEAASLNRQLGESLEEKQLLSLPTGHRSGVVFFYLAATKMLPVYLILNTQISGHHNLSWNVRINLTLSSNFEMNVSIFQSLRIPWRDNLAFSFSSAAWNQWGKQPGAVMLLDNCGDWYHLTNPSTSPLNPPGCCSEWACNVMT